MSLKENISDFLTKIKVQNEINLKILNEIQIYLKPILSTIEMIQNNFNFQKGESQISSNILKNNEIFDELNKKYIKRIETFQKEMRNKIDDFFQKYERMNSFYHTIEDFIVISNFCSFKKLEKK